MSKKFLAILLTTFLTLPAFAADKAKIKVGPAKASVKAGGQTGSLAAQSQGDFINILIGGVSKSGASATLNILLPADATLEQGTEIEVFSTIGEESADNPGEAAVSFTAVKSKGTKVLTLSDAAETVTTGKIKVKAYDPETKELKFSIKAKAKPVNQNKVSLKNPTGGNETVNKAVPIKGQVVITLP